MTTGTRHRRRRAAELLLSEINRFGAPAPADDAANLFRRCLDVASAYVSAPCVLQRNKSTGLFLSQWIKSCFTLQSRREFHSVVVSTWQSLSCRQLAAGEKVLLLLLYFNVCCLWNSPGLTVLGQTACIWGGREKKNISSAAFGEIQV